MASVDAFTIFNVHRTTMKRFRRNYLAKKPDFCLIFDPKKCQKSQMCSLSADSSPKYAENMNDPSSQTGELWANGEKFLNSVKRV